MADTHFTIEGNLTRDPEKKYLASGVPKVRLGIAVNKRWTDQGSREQREQVHYFDVECWRDLAENVSDSLAKGNRVLCTGTIEYQEWETESGDKRSRVVFVAQVVAPSLRWATASPVKVAKSENGRQPASVGASAEGEAEFGDEEPF